MTFETLTKQAASKIHYGGLDTQQVTAEFISEGHSAQLAYFAAKGGAILLKPIPDYASPAKAANLQRCADCFVVEPDHHPLCPTVSGGVN